MKEFLKSEFTLRIRKTTQLLAAIKNVKVQGNKAKICFFSPFLGLFLPLLAQAQPITPANDGTGTLVTPNGNRIDISGGQTSADGTNLFHNFTQFNLTQEQIANFLSTPKIQNILGRVTGGDISVIDGLLQVSGGNSNLFLINPAGIVFGANARLNVPADFTATTATHLGFGDNWLSAVGSNNYAALVGTPRSFAFNLPKESQNVAPGVLVNAGQLTVGAGDLTLLGGTVVSIGQLSAPGGQVTVASVPGESLVRLNQVGHLLSLEIQPSPPLSPSTSLPLSLPQLLTNPDIGNATGLTLSGNGTVQLTGAGVGVASGDSVVQAVTAQDAVLSAQGKLHLVGSQLRTTKDLQLLAQDTVQVRDSATTLFLAQAGENFVIQGVQGIDIQLGKNPQTPFQSTGNFSLISNGDILTNANFSSGKNFSILNLAGKPGNFVGTNDPIITVGGDFTAGSYSGTALKIQSAGNISFSGDITITAAATDLADAPVGTDEFLLGNFPALILRSGDKITVSGDINTASGTTLDGGPVILSSIGSIATGDINSGASSSGNGGGISLSSQNGAINTGNLSSVAVFGNGGDISLSGGDNIQTGEILTRSINGNGGNVTLNSGGLQSDIQISSINAQGGQNGRGGTVDITMSRFFRATDTLKGLNDSVSISTAGGAGGGSITIRNTGNQQNAPFVVGNATLNGTAGAITSGGSTIAPVQSFLDDQTIGNIQIDTIDSDQDQIELQEEPIPPPQSTIPPAEIDAYVAEREEGFTSQFSRYLGLQTAATPPKSLTSARQILAQIQTLTGVKPAFMYISFVSATLPPKEGGKQGSAIEPQSSGAGELGITKGVRQRNTGTQLGNNPQSSIPYSQFSSSDSKFLDDDSTLSVQNPKDQLELVVVTAEGPPIYKRMTGLSEKQVLKVADQFRKEVIRLKRNGGYLEPSQQLYRWLVAPMEAELQARGIKNLVFLLDSGLRSVPMAALHDGKRFLVERYSVSLMPSLTLSNTDFHTLKEAKVLAMGASEFTDHRPLPAVPVELSMITPRLWLGKSFLNQSFTLNNLKIQRRLQPFRIVHLATHAEFKSGDSSNSYLQLWDGKLSLRQLKQLNWNNPPVDLLVLSACRTALGDEEAEMGFAGLAVESGVKSALASLWYVSDEGTLALMTKFYAELKKAPTRTEALRRAQVAMLKGQSQIVKGELRSSVAVVPLPGELADLENKDLSHPYYWAAFTMIGNPW